jgi:hypothetical protein
MDWAKERKQQFLRNRARGGSVNSRSDHTEPLRKTETETWIEIWYTPPSLPSRMARQKVISSDALYQKMKDAEALEVRDAQEENQPKSQTPVFKNLPSSLPSTSSIQDPSTFEIGQQVVLRPDSQRVPAGIPIDTVLIVQEMYVNVYRQHQNIWCVWCSSDAFSGLKSIDSDCLMPLLEITHIANPERVSAMDLEDFYIDEKADSSSSHPAVIYEFVEDGQRLTEVLKPLQSCQAIAVDTETTGLDPLKDRIRLVQIAAANQPVIIIDLFKVAKETLVLSGLSKPKIQSANSLPLNVH